MSREPAEGSQGVGRVVDPTKNVLDLVEAAVERLDDLFEAGVKRLDERIDALVGRIEAEAGKSTALRAQREFYEARIEGLLERQADKSAILLAQTVDKVTERLAVVEKNQYTSGGQTSVRDPATADALARISVTLAELSSKGNQTEGRSTGIEKAWGILVSAISAVGIIVTILLTRK